MRIRPAVLAAVLVLAGCGDDEPTADEVRAAEVDRLADDLLAEADGALPPDAARCVAAELVDGIGVARYDEVVAAAAGEGDEAMRDQVVDVFAACDALDPLLDDG